MFGVLGFTVKPANAGDVPFGVTTLRLLRPPEAFGESDIVIGILVADPPALIPAVTPAPSNVIPVAPVKFTPPIVAGTIDPWVPDDGAIDVMYGTLVAPTVNPENGAEARSRVITVTVLTLGTALGSMVSTTGRFESVPPGEMDAATPVPLIRTAAAPIRFDPVIAARVVAPWTPDAGEID